MERFLDLLTDQRFPWFYPWHFWRSLNKKTSLSNPHSKIVAITFDVEEDYPSKKINTAPLFLEIITPMLRRHNIKATFFTQGSIIPQIAKQLHVLNKQGHEIGVHSLNHDNWGKKVWFLPDEPLTYDQKERDLKKINYLFKKYYLPKPKSFRAPNMNWRKDTFTLLIKHGYEVDSSWDSHRQPSKVFRFGGLWEFPVSSLPIPKPQIRFGLPFTVFRPFNMANYLAMNAGDLENYIQEVQPPLVFLAHPWEFFSNEKYSYCSHDNYNRLEELIGKLKKSDFKFMTMSQLEGMYKFHE